MEELVYFFSNIGAHLSTLVQYVMQAVNAVQVYVPAFLGPEIGALFVAAASVALIMVVVGR